MNLSRLMAGPAIALVAGLASALVATPAQAAVGTPQCRGDVTHNACLTAEKTSRNWWKFTVGLDSYMSERYAREVIDWGGIFVADLYADDSGDDDDHLARVPLAWVGAGPEGLGQEHVGHYSCTLLQEDDGEDEIYAEISWWDPHNNTWTSHDTGTVRHEFICR